MRPSRTGSALGWALASSGFLAGCGGAASSGAVPVTVAAPVTWTEGPAGGELVRAPARNALDAPGAFAIVEEETGWLIVAGDVKEEVLASAPVDTSKPKTGVHVLEAKVKLAELGPEMRLEGRTFVLYRGAERKCVARAGAVRAVGFTSDDFSDGDGSDAPAEARPAEEIARDMWTQSNTYIATKVALGPECKGATWARLEELPEPRFATMREPKEPLASQAIAAFQSRPQWLEAQKSFTEANGAPAGAKTGSWEDLGKVTLTEVVAPFAGGTFLLRQAVWDEGCGSNAGLAMLWREDGKLTEVFQADDRFSIEVAMDLDGDGTLEMFGTEGDGPSLRPFWGTEKDDLRQGPFLTHSYAFHGCRC